MAWGSAGSTAAKVGRGRQSTALDGRPAEWDWTGRRIEFIRYQHFTSENRVYCTSVSLSLVQNKDRTMEAEVAKEWRGVEESGME